MPDDGKAVVRTASVLLLTLFALVALRGVVPGAPPPTPDDDPGGTGSLPAVVIMLAVSMAAILVSVLARSGRPRHPSSASEPPRRDRGDAGAFPWRLLLILAAALLAWLLIVVVLMRWTSTIDPPEPAAPTPARAPDVSAQPGGAAPDRDTGGSVFDLLMGTAVALFALSVVASVATRRRRTAAAPAVLDGPAPSPQPPPGPDLARAAERGLAEVGDRSRDPREAIIACYVAMEQELEKSPGTVPQASDTPSEVLARAVARRAVHADSAAQLVELFEEARFSPHVMNEGHRDDAVRALQVVQRELQGVT
ncbi:DUF4129 domain-containing protein [Mycolicibacterium sp. 018/SC-01/001]|uniref:DUF4129 domain-containing protein n=1 Tax=Mycolicibacterium sp. 018/SC-01/001 TaxID=2592069 RepID=UPI00117CB934|nr:DUF4129 domain-containing protein [Mycolicibacterium sp. 018/SC-01/001]TRW87853.1 DUF4129 domain-containing protein [Mycolicibacterium sp. 018/SC-01/001]